MQLRCKDKTLDLSKLVVMGILNVTPDSFSDGGRFVGHDAALRQAEAMLNDGAAIIDIGGESTRPGAKAVSVDEEVERVVPVIEAISQAFDTVISVDTSKPEVMRAASQAGARIINDVRALREQDALRTAADLSLPVCLMHMQGQPRDMQQNPNYNNVVDDVLMFLREQIQECNAHGIANDQIMIDPGFGFGKTLEHNLQLLQQVNRFSELEVPVLIGISRKSMIGAVTNTEVEDRLIGSVAAAVICAMKGAHIFRVHDVKETVQALTLYQAMHDA